MDLKALKHLILWSRMVKGADNPMDNRARFEDAQELRLLSEAVQKGHIDAHDAVMTAFTLGLFRQVMPPVT